jgi:hypothetical protein
MRATIHDATGPRWLRALLPAFGVLVTLGALVALLFGAPSSLVPLPFAGVAFTLVSPYLLGRFRPRVAAVTPTPGRLVVSDAGHLSQTIRGADVLGVSSARTPAGYTMAIELAYRAAPIRLDFKDETDLRAALDAIGVTRRAFGVLTWSTVPSMGDYVRPISRITLAAVSLFAAFTTATISISFEWIMMVLSVVALSTPLLAFALSDAGDRASAHLRMANDGLWVRHESGSWTHFPYASIASVRVEGETLVLRGVGGGAWSTRVSLSTRGRRSVSRDELDHAIAQIKAAAQRARGEVPPPPDEGTVGTLRRMPGEPARAWLGRIEATAHHLRAGGGYRGAMVASEDLWAVLRDHDADVDVRAAAAGVLSRFATPEERGRIDGVLASMRDSGARVRLRIAMEPDAEEAAIELDRLDAREASLLRR